MYTMYRWAQLLHPLILALDEIPYSRGIQFTLESTITLSNTGGSYCDQYNGTTVSGTCDAGYYCTSGAQSAMPSSEENAGPCPPGYETNC